MKDLPTPRSLVLLAAFALAGCGGDKLDPRLQEGYDLVVAGKVDEAIALANAFLADDPGNAPARNLIGLALYKAGDTQGAVEQFQQSLEMKPDYPEAHFNLGNAYRTLDRKDDAMREYELAVEYQPKFVLANYNIGTLQQEAGNTDAALTAYRKCVDHDPQFFYAYLGMGDILYASGDFENAISNLERALELAPTQKEIRVLLGNAYLQSGRPDAASQAEAEFRAALGVDPAYVDAVYNLGVSLHAQNRVDEAAVQFRHVLELVEGNAARAGMTQQVNSFLQQYADSSTAAAQDG